MSTFSFNRPNVNLYWMYILNIFCSKKSVSISFLLKMFFNLGSIQKLKHRERPSDGSERSSITQLIYDYIHDYATRRRLNICRPSDSYEVIKVLMIEYD